MSRFTERHLDPGSRFGEILFGLIMVLTVTLAARFNVAEGRKGVRQLLLSPAHDHAIHNVHGGVDDPPGNIGSDGRIGVAILLGG